MLANEKLTKSPAWKSTNVIGLFSGIASFLRGIADFLRSQESLFTKLRFLNSFVTLINRVKTLPLLLSQQSKWENRIRPCYTAVSMFFWTPNNVTPLSRFPSFSISSNEVFCPTSFSYTLCDSCQTNCCTAPREISTWKGSAIRQLWYPSISGFSKQEASDSSSEACQWGRVGSLQTAPNQWEGPQFLNMKFSFHRQLYL